LDWKSLTFHDTIDKIEMVKRERQSIIAFTEKKLRALGSRPGSPDANMTAKELKEAEARRSAALIEMVYILDSVSINSSYFCVLMNL
jgi:hypothetical protein